MATEFVEDLRRTVADQLGLQQQAVYCTTADDTVSVTVTGELHGRSARNAARRRQRVSSIAKRIAEQHGYHLSLTFAVRDALSALEDSINTTANLVLGCQTEVVNLQVKRNGNAAVTLSISKTEDDSKTQLERVLRPLLHQAGLSSVSVSVLSPEKDVSTARLLRAAKTLAPCSAREVVHHFREKDQVDLQVEAVHRRLDALRKRGLLVYVGDRRFVLSLKGLASMPKSNRRDSSDVERVLLLNRRTRSW